MEDNHNKNSRNLNLRSQDTSIDLKLNLPDWLLEYFNPFVICTAADINDNLPEGYPDDDDF